MWIYRIHAHTYIMHIYILYINMYNINVYQKIKHGSTDSIFERDSLCRVSFGDLLVVPRSPRYVGPGWVRWLTRVKITFGLRASRNELWLAEESGLKNWVYHGLPGWWFQTFFIFHNIWDSPSHWLIFFKVVKTTNQLPSGKLTWLWTIHINSLSLLIIS